MFFQYNMDYFRTCVIKIITFHSRRPFQTTGQIVTHKNMPATTTSTISEQIHDAFPTLNTAQQFAHARAMARKQLVALKNEVGACLMLECGVRNIYLSIFFLLFPPFSCHSTVPLPGVLFQTISRLRHFFHSRCLVLPPSPPRHQLSKQGVIDGAAKVTTSSHPFLVFSRLAAGVMKQDNMVEANATLSADLTADFLLACNRPEADEK